MIKINKEIINDALWVLYEDWLLKKIGLDKSTVFRKYYSKLLIDLHFIEFTYIVDKDKNRAEDGIYLRNEFLEYNQPETISMANPCSVLEMLIALSLRIQTEYIGDQNILPYDNIFIEFLDNLSLLDFDNDHYYIDSYRKVNNIVGSWLNRDFNRDGCGSIFPLERRERKYPNQRNIEIWGQMQWYILEKYKER